MGREKYLGIALAVISLLLVGLLVWEVDQALRLEQELLKMRSIPAIAAKPLNILPEFSLPPAESAFPDVISRSLFSVNRRSSATAGKGGVSAMKKGQFVLVGVLITPKQRSAQLRDVQTNRAETVTLNGVVRGMTVGDIDASKVVLRQGSESEELALNVQTGPKAAVAAKAPAPPPPPAPPASSASSAIATPPATPGPALPSSAPSAAASAPARTASGPAIPVTPASAPAVPAKPGEQPPAPQVPPSAPPRVEPKK